MRRFALRRAAVPSRDEKAQVLDALRFRRLHRRGARDRIPAFLVVGPPGMGKSALVQRSGLRVDRPLDLSSSSWWIGEDGLFVEVPLTKADPDGSHPVFGLLGAIRPAVPVSGIVLVVSPADLTLADATDRSDMSAALVDFLRAFEARFRYAPPLYIVVSKLDLTPGFAEFFDRLEPAEREQPWGFTLPVGLGRHEAAGSAPDPEGSVAKAPPPARTNSVAASAPDIPAGRGVNAPADAEPEGVAAAYRTGLDRVLDAIRTRVTQWVSPETDPLQCARIAGFGAQVAALSSILKPLVEPLFPADDRRWRGAWLRGLYLTSTQQDALSIDVLLPDMAKRFGLPRTGTLPPDLGRDEEALGYFVGGVFRRVILPEAGLAQQGHRGMRLRAARNWTLAAVAVAACGVLGFLFALQYQAGVMQIGLASQAVAAVGPTLSSGDPDQAARMLPALDVFDTLGGSGAGADPNRVFQLDRYAGALIDRAAAGIYDRAVGASLAPYLAYRLDRALVDLSASSQALRASLTAAAADRSDSADAYRDWLHSAAVSLPPSVRDDLERHGLQALELGAAPGAGSAYTEAARGILDSRGEAPQ